MHTAILKTARYWPLSHSPKQQYHRLDPGLSLPLSPTLVQDILQWDTGTWSHALALWEQCLPRHLAGYKTLELGASQGGISLWLALKQAQVVCSDINSPHLQSQVLHQKYALENVRYAAIDATQLPFDDESLDIVCCKSVLGGIRKFKDHDPKPGIVAEIYRVLKPGGWFLSADNLYASPLHQHLRSQWVSWSKGWEYFHTQDVLALLSDFNTVHYTTAGLVALTGRTPTQRKHLSQWESSFQKIFIQSFWQQWHYMIATAAQK